MSKKSVIAPVESSSNQIAEVKIKSTPVMERRYMLLGERPLNVKSKQGSIVLDILAGSTDPLTIEEIAAVAEEKGLKAVGGVTPSVRYHLHHLTKDGVTTVTNPTITL
jgi:hypothetical protein